MAAQPSAHVVKAGKPFEDITAGRGVPLESVTWSALNGLYDAVLFVEPPSTTCHSSRSATPFGVTEAPTPSRTQVSQPERRAGTSTWVRRRVGADRGGEINDAEHHDGQ